MAFVYIIKCADNTMYTGYTLDLRRRIAVHNAGRGAKYTKTRLPVRLLWAAELSSVHLAKRAEVLIKDLSTAKKKQLAAGRITLEQACPRLYAKPAKKEKTMQIPVKQAEALAWDTKMLALAVQQAEQGSLAGDGGPFGAVVATAQGEIVSAAHNQVLLAHDPTAHAEVMAIRKACAKLGTHDLQGCTLYTSCEPCPMCLSAIIWANIERVVYGCTREDAAAIGFRDEKIYDFLAGCGEPPLAMRELDRAECQKVFAEYKQHSGSLY